MVLADERSASVLSFPPRASGSDAARAIALVGNPNTGKTTLFNRLCGARAKTSNFPGTTTSIRTGRAVLPDESTIDVVDLPGPVRAQPRRARVGAVPRRAAGRGRLPPARPRRRGRRCVQPHAQPRAGRRAAPDRAARGRGAEHGGPRAAAWPQPGRSAPGRAARLRRRADGGAQGHRAWTRCARPSCRNLAARPRRQRGRAAAAAGRQRRRADGVGRPRRGAERRRRGRCGQRRRTRSPNGWTRPSRTRSSASWCSPR